MRELDAIKALQAIRSDIEPWSEGGQEELSELDRFIEELNEIHRETNARTKEAGIIQLEIKNRHYYIKLDELADTMERYIESGELPDGYNDTCKEYHDIHSTVVKEIRGEGLEP